MPRTKQRNQPVTLDGELCEDLRAARTPTAIVRALARKEYRRTHPDRDCPDAEIPGLEDLVKWSRESAAGSTVSVPWLTENRQTTETMLVEKHRAWVDDPSENPAKHPLECLVQDWLAVVPNDLGRRHLVTPAEMTERGELEAVPLVRAPGTLSLASFSPIVDSQVEAIEVDGVLVACPTAPGSLLKRTYRRAREPTQGELIPGPRSLAGNAVSDIVVSTLSRYELTGDERSSIRSDVHRIALFTFAVTGPVRVAPEQGALFVGGMDSPANRRRWWAAVETLRGMTIRTNPRTGEFRDLAVISIGDDGAAFLAPPAWWRGTDAWRLAGGLFRKTISEREAKPGVARGYWGNLDRTIAGIEAALAWSPAAGRGKFGRVPDNLRPESGKKGPGPMVFIPWRKVLELSGEHLPADSDPKGAEGRRYRRRVEQFELAGYRWMHNGGEAPAGDTIEVEPRIGNRGRSAGLLVRTSARMVAAVARAQNRSTWSREPALQFFA